MSLSPAPLVPNGVYRIVNVQYNTQDADLIFPGGKFGVIGGYHDNNTTKRMLWEVQNVAPASGTGVVGDQVVFLNQEIATYASALQAAINQKVAGDTIPMVWSLKPVNQGYQITALDAPIVWSLADGNDSTPVTLQPLYFANGQTWKFVPEK